MKAMVLRAPRDLVLTDVGRPEPQHDQVLVRITNSGVCGTDLKIYEGAISVHHPLIMGHEMIGEVAQDAGKFHAGDRVIVDPVNFCGSCFHCRAGQTNLCPQSALSGRDTDGGFADYVVAPLSHVYSLPAAIDSQSAPLIQVVTTCLHGQRLIDVFPGQSVVVIGLGVTGQIHAQIAKTWGAYPVIGITRSQWKRSLAQELGADLTLPSGPDGIRGVMEATNGRGADLIIETTGVVSAIDSAISMARLGGTILLFGITAGTSATLPFYQMYFKELKIVNSRAAKSEDYPASMELIARGALKLKPLITHKIELPELASAMEMLASDEDHRLKIVVNNAS